MLPKNFEKIQKRNEDTSLIEKIHSLETVLSLIMGDDAFMTIRIQSIENSSKTASVAFMEKDLIVRILTMLDKLLVPILLDEIVQIDEELKTL